MLVLIVLGVLGSDRVKKLREGGVDGGVHGRSSLQISFRGDEGALVYIGGLFLIVLLIDLGGVMPDEFLNDPGLEFLLGLTHGDMLGCEFDFFNTGVAFL